MRKKFLIIYGIVVAVILILILFIIPDSFFLKPYEKNFYEIFGDKETTDVPTEQAKTNYTDYEEQKEHLLKGNYKYSYQMLPLVNGKSVIYNCDGEVADGKEEGSCTKPSDLQYTEKNKEKILKDVNLNYLKPEYIFDLIKDQEVEPIDYTGYRVYKYSITINKLETEIEIATGKAEINQIEISNRRGVYVLKFSDIKY
ncbi:MAG: hypothetical protein IKP07_06040 [Bacilli bacterium]|nr:hypothetical protein [Bacilli bacterium]